MGKNGCGEEEAGERKAGNEREDGLQYYSLQLSHKDIATLSFIFKV